MKKLKKSAIIWIIMLGGILRGCVVYFVEWSRYQNDVGAFADGSKGHLGYINYLFTHNLVLPNFDVRSTVNGELSQFYHPPLHHWIGAIWVKINSLVQMDFEKIIENLQVIPLFYSILTLVVVDRILIKINCTREGRVFGVAILSVFPYLIVSAGALNNDNLMLLFSVLSIYMVISWYKNANYSKIILLALFIGLSMMTKLSGALIAPPIAFLMLVKFFQNKDKWKQYIKQFMIFGFIVFPLGLWFPIRNLVLFNIPITYIPSLTKDSTLYVGMYGLLSRIFDFNKAQFMPQMELSFSNINYNIGVCLNKFAAFGESAYFRYNGITLTIGMLLFYSLPILIGMLCCLCMVSLCNKTKLDQYLKWFFILIILCVGGSYIRFCFVYPYVCTMNIRYVLIAFIALIILASDAMEVIGNKYKQMKKMRYSIIIIVAIYSVLSISSVYGMIRGFRL